MTFSEKGLARAMKTAYKNYGYTAAQSDSGLMIIADSWGVGIKEILIKNEIKGLIVCHAGKLPNKGEAIFVQKNSASNQIYEVAVGRVRDLKQAWSDGLTLRIMPTRFTLDGMVIWQKVKDLKMAMVDPEDMQVIDFTDLNAFEVAGAIYHENYAGFVYVEPGDPEDKSILLKHLEQMQCIPADVE